MPLDVCQEVTFNSNIFRGDIAQDSLATKRKSVSLHPADHYECSHHYGTDTALSSIVSGEEDLPFFSQADRFAGQLSQEVDAFVKTKICSRTQETPAQTFLREARNAQEQSSNLFTTYRRGVKTVL